MKKTILFLFIILALYVPLNNVAMAKTQISEEEYKKRVTDFYAAYKTGNIQKNKISKSGWKVIYEYELEQGYTLPEDVPQWAIDAFNIDLSVAKEREPQFYKYLPILILIPPFIHHMATKRNKEVN